MSLDATLTITLCLSLCTLAITVATAFFFYRRVKGVRIGSKDVGQNERILTPLQILIFGVFIAATIAFYPLYYVDFLSGDSGFVRVIKSLLLAMQNVLRLFTLNGEFDNVRDLVSDTTRVSASLGQAYTVYMAIIFIAAPILTATFVLSFFKEAVALLRCRVSVAKNVYYMSELNECSVTLAEDILSENGTGEDKGSRKVIFTDVYRRIGEDRHEELMEKAKRLGAVLVKRDITKLHLSCSRQNVVRKLYFIGENMDENLRQALTVINDCRDNDKYDNPNTKMYVFATNAESETLLDSAENGKMTVRRINDNRDLVLETFRRFDLFGGDAEVVRGKLAEMKKQFEADKSDEAFELQPVIKRDLHFVIVGLGGYGTEMLKSLCWYCQIPGYKPVIDVFDKDPDAEDVFRGVAPELLTTRNEDDADEAKYDIIFHAGVNVKRERFLQDIEDIDKRNPIDSVFVTLGDDELNVETAIKIRVRLLQSKFRLSGDPKTLALYEKLDKMEAEEKAEYLDGVAQKPSIYSVVFSDSKNKTVESGLKDRNKEDYHITFIGAMKSRYTLAAIERRELESLGFELHSSWALKGIENEADRDRIYKEHRDSYENYEYFRRSSMARAVYNMKRDEFGYIEVETPSNAFDAALSALVKKTEHLRWNAYMRSEGYVKAIIKYDLGKLHNLLLTYTELTDLKDTLGSAKLKSELDKDSSY